MGDEYVTPEDFAVMVQSLGREGAQQWAAKRGIVIAEDPTDDGPAQEMQMDDDLNTDAQDDTFVAGALPSGGAGLQNALSAYNAAQGRVDAQIKANIDLLTAGRDRLREQRLGPSKAEQWFALAAALGKPTRTGSFGESLGNVNEVLGEQAATARKAAQERQDLLDRYGMQIGGEQLRLLQSGATQAGKIYERELAARAAAQKAGQPTYTIDQQGRLREVPKRVHRPQTAAEYAAIPVGSYYVVPAGEDAGKIVMKQAGGR